MKTLPILKNGSRADELKSCTVEDFGKVILSNTCAFDSVSSILMVAYCDSVNYNTEVDGLENIFLKFIAGIVKNGISAKTYLTRAEIVIKYLKPRVEYLEYNTTLAVCDTTVGNVFKQLLVEFPTVLDNIQCSTSNCNKTTKCYPIPVPYITIHITDGKLNSLEEDLKKRLLIENTSCNHLDKKENKCRGLKTIQPSVSLMHLFIELLNWQEDAVDYSTEVAQQVEVCLENVPPVMNINNIKYELRGVCSHRHGISRLRHSVGHYQSYCKRNSTNQWELYDDLKSKPMPVKSNSKVPCEFLVYTI